MEPAGTCGAVSPCSMLPAHSRIPGMSETPGSRISGRIMQLKEGATLEQVMSTAVVVS